MSTHKKITSALAPFVLPASLDEAATQVLNTLAAIPVGELAAAGDAPAKEAPHKVAGKKARAPKKVGSKKTRTAKAEGASGRSAAGQASASLRRVQYWAQKRRDNGAEPNPGDAFILKQKLDTLAPRELLGVARELRKIQKEEGKGAKTKKVRAKKVRAKKVRAKKLKNGAATENGATVLPMNVASAEAVAADA